MSFHLLGDYQNALSILQTFLDQQQVTNVLIVNLVAFMAWIDVNLVFWTETALFSIVADILSIDIFRAAILSENCNSTDQFCRMNNSFEDVLY